MITELFQIDRSRIKVDQPLQWDVFTAQGKLLLHKGSTILGDSQLERLLEFGMYVNKHEVQRQLGEGARRSFDPFFEFDDLRGWLGRLHLSLMKLVHAPEPGPAPTLLADIDQVARRIDVVVSKAPDAALFQIMQMNTTQYAIAHHLQAAALCAMVARSMGWSGERVHNACRAALTMNIGMLDLQTRLASQAAPLTEEQRAAVEAHGARGRNLLQAFGVTDPEWLDAVAHHHPERAPAGTAISPLARLLHHVDVYLAKVTPRAYRCAKNTQAAARELLQDARLDMQISSSLIKMVGIYPPGTYVKLVNGDSAVVVRRGASVHTPAVCSLQSGARQALGEPVARDTALPKFAVASLLSGATVTVAFDRSKLFRLAAAVNPARAAQAEPERAAAVG
jgi:hypothetical protein